MFTDIVLAQASDLFSWYNAVFITFFGVGLMFTMLQVIGLGSESDLDADGDADVDVDADADVDVGVDTDVDVDVDADVDADIDADLDADVDMDADADADVDADADGEAHVDVHGHEEAFSLANVIAQLFGLGKVPLSISLMTLCYSVGFIGILSNELIAPRFGSPDSFFPISMLIALVGGFGILRLLSAFMARYMPSFSTSALAPKQLVGLKGKAVLPISERIGRVSVYDKYGTLHVVKCCVRKGGKPIAKGQDVVLVKYRKLKDMYIVGRA